MKHFSIGLIVALLLLVSCAPAQVETATGENPSPVEKIAWVVKEAQFITETPSMVNARERTATRTATARPTETLKVTLARTKTIMAQPIITSVQRMSPTKTDVIQATVLRVNYEGQIVEAASGGRTGPNIIVGNAVEVGTRENQKIVEGDIIYVRPTATGWVIDNHITNPRRIGRFTPTPVLISAPILNRVEFIGNSLTLDWDPSNVPGVTYRIWRNNTPSPISAQMIAATQSTEYTIPDFQPYTTEFLENGNFEIGTMIGWEIGVNGTGSIGITTEEKRNGLYSAKFNAPTNFGSVFTMVSTKWNVPANQHFRVRSSVYLKTLTGTPHAPGQNDNTFSIAVAFYDANLAHITSEVLCYLDTVMAGWNDFESFIQSPPNTATMRFEASIATDNGQAVIYVDNLSLVGIDFINPLNQYYAVNAMLGGQVSPFSDWKVPTFSSSSVSDPANPVNVDDFINAKRYSSNYKGGVIASGYQLTPQNGFEGSLTNPIISSFVNARHMHGNRKSGGTITRSAQQRIWIAENSK